MAESTTGNCNEVDDVTEYVTMETQTTDTFARQFFHTSDTVHAVTVILFASIGFLGNTMVIYIYTKKSKHYTGNVYAIALAMLDIFACVTLLPQFPLLQYYAKGGGWYSPQIVAFFTLMMFIMLSYLWILAFIAVDRASAVFRPFAYKNRKRRSIVTTLVGITISLVISTVSQLADQYSQRISVGLAISTAWVILFLTYPAITYKVYKRRWVINVRQNTQTVTPKVETRSTQENKVGTSQTRSYGGSTSERTAVSTRSKDLNKNIRNFETLANTARVDMVPTKSGTKTSQASTSDTSKRSGYLGNQMAMPSNQMVLPSNQNRMQHRHVTTVKMFVAVTFLFLVSFVPAIIKMLDVVENFHIMYIYFLNHIGNPIIYFSINQSFRKDVKNVLTKIRYSGCFRN